MQRITKVARSPLFMAAFLVLSAAAFLTRDHWVWYFSDSEAQTLGAFAPGIDDLDEDADHLYRIASDEESSATYVVQEELAGRDRTARGTTRAIAGDIAVNVEDPSASRIGQIVINVEQFDSDSNLRDRRIRHDFLESTDHPMATFSATTVEGVPDVVEGETTGELTVTGDLTIKETTAPVTFTGPVTVTDDRLEAEMSGTLLMSTYDIGPIHVAGLAHTGDEVTFELDIVAERVDVHEPPPERGSVDVAQVDIPDGEFAATVQPILETNCVSCHEAEAAGNHTVPLETAGDAAQIAEDIALVTESRFMPPWPASDLGPEFEHDYSLTDEEIATIAEWSEDGGGLDVDPDTELEADDPPFDEIERDLVVPPAEAYVGSTEVRDDYRCQVHEIEDPEGDGTWVTGMGFEPDQLEIVHHSIVFRVPAEGMAEARRLEALDPQPGWQCFGTANMATDGVISIGGWAPGQQPRVYPEGVGIHLQPGDFIVNQIHYHYDDEAPADLSALVFDTLSTEELEARDEPMTSIAGRSYLTPAEGPCTPEESGPLCDRDTMLDDIADRFGFGARFIPDALIARCGGDREEFAQLDGTVFRSSCDLPAADYGTLFSVLGHMHEFGAAYRMTLNPDTPEERVLLDIPNWSFEWQLYYVPVETIRIEPGDVIRYECTWDRENAAMPEPRYITWNEGTYDEMCFSSVTVIPDTNSEGTPNRFAP